MGDISLTSGMRANLLSLQSSVKLLDRTQERLSTGKKVNSALDNPVNFFTAQSHTSRANDLLAFKDAISESIQTIKAADTAITAITTLINSAKAVAEDAKGTLGESSYSQTLTVNTTTGLSGGNTISIGGSTFTAVTSAGSDTGANFYIGGSTTSDWAIGLAQAINRTTETTEDMTASVSNNVLTISAVDTAHTMVTGDIDVGAYTSVFTESSIGSGTELAAKVTQYNTLMSQLNDLKSDAFYKGKNLLNSETMTVRFGNDHTLSVTGFDGSAAGLGLDATASWSSESTIQSSIDKITDALTTLRIESSKLSSNLSIVDARDEWISSIANVLQTGADNLTLADTNEEGANMLMLQTRQSLSTSALSLSAQAAQSVLRLFQ